MSAHEWKPGDVAMVRKDGKERPAIKSMQERWWLLDTGTWTETLEPLRPLVVIDPESRGRVEHLRDLFVAAYSEQTGYKSVDRVAIANALQAALREFATPTPPKPDEPQGLGAVVEDAKGDQWVLIEVTGQDLKPVRQWRTRWGNRPWDQIAAVRVLSEGVS